MLFYSQIRYEEVVLGTETKGVSNGFHVGFDVITLDQSGTRRGAYQPGQHGHGGGLSGTVVAKQNSYLIGLHVHREFVHDVLTGREAFAERLDLYAGLFGHAVGTDFFVEPVRRLYKQYKTKFNRRTYKGDSEKTLSFNLL